jgi:O-antigen/teichoic acid export membrane protein
MSEQKNSYRKIIKATSIFGGVQVFTILISILRSKFVALFLGTSGMGTLGLLNTTLGLVGGLTNFGLGTSAVREVSVANSSGDLNKIATVILVLRRWAWITGILGALIIVIFSSFLSQITFGDTGYIWSFVLVSFTNLFNQLNSGQLALLQGMQKIHFLAKASLSGSFLGLLLNVPIYYYYGVQGIVPALILASMISFFISRYYAKKIIFQKFNITYNETFSEGKKMIKMGFLISLNGLFVIGSTYIIQLFINKYGGASQVGLFTAGFAIINTYVGLIFTALSTDYYPRLSAVAHSNELCKKEINQQAEISILLLGPIIIIFIVFIKLIIFLLYSNSFYAIGDMVSWLAIATFFKASAWSIGFILLAKGESKVFFFNDFLGSFYMLVFDLVGYYWWGLTGLGISFFIGYFIYFFQVYFLSKKRYGFSFQLGFVKIFSVHFLLAIFCLFSIKLVYTPYTYLIGSIFVFLSIYYSYSELDKRLNIKSFFKRISNKNTLDDDKTRM